MRTHALVALSVVLALVVAGCAGTNGSSSSSSRSGRGAAPTSSRVSPDDVKPVEEPARVAWISLKVVRTSDGKRATSQLNLINQANPASRKPIPLDRPTKVLTNEQMGALVAVLDEQGFSKFARAGLAPDRVPAGTANGMIVVQRGGVTKGLLFQRGVSAERSDLPVVYRRCKDAIWSFFNAADAPQVYTSDRDRVLEIDPRLPGGVRR